MGIYRRGEKVEMDRQIFISSLFLNILPCRISWTSLWSIWTRCTRRRCHPCRTPRPKIWTRNKEGDWRAVVAATSTGISRRLNKNTKKNINEIQIIIDHSRTTEYPFIVFFFSPTPPPPLYRPQTSCKKKKQHLFYSRPVQVWLFN